MKAWNRSHTLYVVIGIVALIISGSILEIYKTKREQSYIDSQYKQLNIKFDAAINLYARLSEEVYDRYEDDFAKTLYTASFHPQMEADERQKLFDRHIEEYNNLNLQGISQLHLHTADGRSFLRYHLAERFGDSLIAIRPSIRKVIAEHRYIYGYEIGRKYGGFRYLYPLFYKGEYVGSMEFGVDFDTIDKEMRKQFGGQYTFLVIKKDIDAVVWEKYKKAFCSPSLFSEAYLSIDNRNQWFKSSDFDFRGDSSVQTDFDSNIPFYRYVMTSKGKKLILFLPILNINGENQAYLVSVMDTDALQHISEDFWLQIILVSSIIFLVMIVFFRRNAQNQEITAILNQQHELVFLTDGEKVSNANKSFLDFFGFESVKSFRSKHNCVCDFFLEKPGYLQRINNEISWLQVILGHPNEQHRVLMRNRSGSERTFLISVNMYGYDDRYVCTMTDITRIDHESHELAEKAYLDTLTGLFNRRKADEFFTREIEASRDSESPLSMAMLDIDMFKQINDTYGHDRGDEILQYLSDLLKKSVRENDIIFRWGGEEFIILFPQMSRKNAADFCESLRKSIECFTFGDDKHLTCSFGITELQSEDIQRSFIARADQALYMAKTRGRNRIETL